MSKNRTRGLIAKMKSLPKSCMDESQKLAAAAVQNRKMVCVEGGGRVLINTGRGGFRVN